MINPTKRNDNVSLLAPWLQRQLIAAIKQCHAEGLMFHPFECWRSPARQDELYSQGRGNAGKIVTNARAWASIHQYGLAVDIAAKHDGKWTWDESLCDYNKPAAIFREYGFEWGGSWGDRPHYQIACGISHQEMLEITKTHGLQWLWLMIEDRFQSRCKNIIA